jgi:hypothetical protein
MHSYRVTDVNEALQRGVEHLLLEGTEETSRAGDVLVAPGPVCIEYVNPRQRVLLSATRDANPFFHFMESIWIISGGNDLEFPCFFNKSYEQFSDDGITMWDAYGFRIRKFFGYDQLELVVKELLSNSTSRRCVVSLWNAWPRAGDYEQNRESNTHNDDLHDNDLHVATHGGKAVPCNTTIYFLIRAGKLDMMVCNRSNDLILGMCGANVVHFSLLLEYMAMRVKVPIGHYTQVSNNMHSYLARYPKEKLAQVAYECDTLGKTPALGPLIEPGFDEDLPLFMKWAREVIARPEDTAVILDVPACKTPFMHAVAVPMFLAWAYRKRKDEYSSQICLDGIDAPDWKRACAEWVERRQK